MRSTQNKIVTPATLPARDGLGKVGVCTGCYDILQSGHAVFFEQCKEFCDTLIVVVGNGAAVAKLKPGRPLNPDPNRLFLVAALEAVDFALIGDEELLPGKIDCYSLCDQLTPDVYILNDDDSGLAEKRAFCEARGIKLELVSRVVPAGLIPTSTTDIAEKLRNAD
ncbi:MAG: adenylyltransferase/cytidyltransferase family protein [Verrucomicrobiales bacterium]|nr:adenylyltransferase/cytidyltransferase family protein [Verrucomicrobiota bacterium JB025]